MMAPPPPPPPSSFPPIDDDDEAESNTGERKRWSRIPKWVALFLRRVKFNYGSTYRRDVAKNADDIHCTVLLLYLFLHKRERRIVFKFITCSTFPKCFFFATALQSEAPPPLTDLTRGSLRGLSEPHSPLTHPPPSSSSSSSSSSFNTTSSDKCQKLWMMEGGAEWQIAKKCWWKEGEREKQQSPLRLTKRSAGRKKMGREWAKNKKRELFPLRESKRERRDF